jgi:HlyD family secretion protein
MAGVVVVVALLGGTFVWKQKANAAEAARTAVKPSDKTDRVVGLGKLLPISGVRTVAAPFGAGDARIATLNVKEGDRVEQGAVIAVLDNERVLQAAVDAAKAQVGARNAAHGQVASSVIASRAELQAQLGRAQATAENASV